MEFNAVKNFVVDKLKKELSPNLHYHSLSHTLDVIDSAERIAKSEGINKEEICLLKTACLFHDTGFLFVYQNHEEKSCKFANETLPKYGYTQNHIDKICEMIMATKIPQTPKSNLGEIICDADLDYLGRDDFDRIANNLYLELQAFNIIDSEEKWNMIQVGFIGNHSYFTETADKTRNKKKQENLEKIQAIVDSYNS
jgi:uncharacterized protein